MAKYISNKELSEMSYNQLGKLVSEEKITLKRLRDYYTQARKKATDRARRISKSEFSEIETPPKFMKLKNLTTASALLHEIADVNRYLKSDKSTLTGQKKTKEKLLLAGEKLGFDVDDSSYIKFRQFLDWFKNSKYTLSYDSDSEELLEAFEEGSSPEDWERIFKEFIERDREAAESGKNNKRSKSKAE